MNIKRLQRILIDVVYIFLTLGILFLMVILNGVFISNITNSLRMTGYLDPTFGIQVILVMVSLIWAPIALLVKHSRE